MGRIDIRLAFSTLLAFAVMTAPAAADVELTLFEKTYERGKGKPVAVTDTFVGRSGEATLTVDTGGSVTSAVVKINGSQILGPSDFKKKVRELGATLLVGDLNELSVEVRGKPGAQLVVHLTQTFDAEVALVVDAAGGDLVVPAGLLEGVTVSLPPGALEAPTVITIAESDPPDLPENPKLERIFTRSFLIEPDIDLAQSASIVLPCEDVDGDGLTDGTSGRGD